ncbi:MAG TPA: hypothetical protein VNW97_14705 [Candidatus Saccharimonadales bacterium]|jgi:hypothetical protein|nr:hypothetical protein [Candidatus Saccharimonadales bacterium]
MTYRQSRVGRQQRVKSALTMLLCAILTLVSFNGCRPSKKDAGLIATSLSMSSYVQARQRTYSSGPSSTSYYFPMLEIYNDTGVLVYRGNESMANAQILKKFPGSVQNLPPREDASRLTKILQEIPDFKVREREIVGQKKPVILSIALESCEGCAIQERALEDLRERLLQQSSVVILEINVARP